MAKGALAQELDYGAYERLFGEPVTISATGKPERLSDTPVQMALISADDIRRSGARDIPTLLRRLAGVDVMHGSTANADVGIGGFIRSLASQVMVLINGRQVYFDAFGAVFWSSLPVELQEIRQIEVIKGAQSALYGFNAVDGVINIVTFDPVDDPINVVTARVGNQARREIAATTTVSPVEGAGLRLTVGGDHANDTGMITRTAIDNDFKKAANRRSASLDAKATLPDDSQVRIEASHTDVSGRTLAYNAFFDARVVTNSVKGDYSADSSLGRWNATAHYTTIDMPWVSSEPVGAQHNNDSMLVAQVSDLFKLGAVDSFRVGAEYRDDRFSSSSLQGGTVTGALMSSSLMWEREWSPSLSMVNAVRYDHFQLGRSGLGGARDFYSNSDFDRAVMGTSVNSALIDKLDDDDTLRLAFGRGLKLPSLVNFGQPVRYLPKYANVFLSENPNLLPVAVYDGRIVWDRRIWDATTARMALFHDMTMKSVGAVSLLVNKRPTLFTMMTPGSLTNGVEFGLDHKAEAGWSWGANYVLDRLHEHMDQGLRNSLPEHKLNLNIGYAWGDWQADLYGSYTSATKGVVLQSGTPPIAAVGTIKAHSQLSPHLAWQARDNVRLELSAENLWPYQDSLLQKMETSYYLSVTISY
ncbi:TonB-dependent receptor plug domain-containing protein [Telmatospirillum sp.]|uniref:TonB-dependent receptor plug domain-containing protein n=1 Tax=Telmatospirillum sp. TaxID=2079197 RepID=UPI00284715FF|nr:TonB-dependent receptor plug domain-containing protein [Telmatospirillum sp.]MDR3441133.1 TonB-dependent receptor plug domain-containing protein [Telmatospirillum sp.]